MKITYMGTISALIYLYHLIELFYEDRQGQRTKRKLPPGHPVKFKSFEE